MSNFQPRSETLNPERLEWLQARRRQQAGVYVKALTQDVAIVVPVVTLLGIVSAFVAAMSVGATV